MAGVRCTELQSRPLEFLDFPSVTLDEFPPLVSPCEAAFHARMTAWRMDGKPQTARRFPVDKNCPLPTPEDWLLFILGSLKTSALHVVHGRLFGMVQGKAHQGMHVLLPALLAALRARGAAPARALTALTQRLGVSEAAAAPVVMPREENPVLLTEALATAPTSPLVPMTAPSGASSAPKTLLHRRRVRAARKRTIRSKCPARQCPAHDPLPQRYLGRACEREAHRRGDVFPLYLPGVSCGRIWVSWPARCPRSRSSCRRRTHAARN